MVTMKALGLKAKGFVKHLFSKEHQVHRLVPHPEIVQLFNKYAGNQGRLSTASFNRFLTEVQLERVTDAADSSASASAPASDGPGAGAEPRGGTDEASMAIEDLLRYLLDPERNAPINTQIHHDMTQPLSSYFIWTGHNSYLSGNQLSSKSGVKPITRALLKGVRVIELDIWPGGDDEENEIQVLHGRTMTKSVPFQDCIRAIRESAFERSQYPVIITLEDHLTPALRAKAAKIISDELSEVLYLHVNHPDTPLDEFPSPEALKNCILISTKHPSSTNHGHKKQHKRKDIGSTNDKKNGGKSREGSRRSSRRSSFGSFSLPRRQSSSSQSDARGGATAEQEETTLGDQQQKQRSQDSRTMVGRGKTLGILSKRLRLTDKDKEGDGEHKDSANGGDSKGNDGSQGQSQSQSRSLHWPLLRRSSSGKGGDIRELSSSSSQWGEEIQSIGTATEKAQGCSSESEDDESVEPSANAALISNDGDSGTQQYTRLISIKGGKLRGKNYAVALQAKGDEVCRLSLSEGVLAKLAKQCPGALVSFSQRNLLRIYPAGSRIDSSNYNPMLAWSHGAQMAAFNMQGWGRPLWLMDGFFAANGQCGYVLKPDALLMQGQSRASRLSSASADNDNGNGNDINDGTGTGTGVGADNGTNNVLPGEEQDQEQKQRDEEEEELRDKEDEKSLAVTKEEEVVRLSHDDVATENGATPDDAAGAVPAPVGGLLVAKEQPPKMTLKVKVLMGLGWSEAFSKNHFDHFSDPDFYVRVGIGGIDADMQMQRTEPHLNSWMPMWTSANTFEFPLRMPELAVLRVECHDHDNGGRDDFAGQAALPVPEILTGYRVVALLDRKGRPLQQVRILFHFEKEVNNNV